MLDKAARIARFARRKGKAARDARPKDYLLGGTLYNGGGWVAGNPRYAESRVNANRAALAIEAEEMTQAKAEDQAARDAENLMYDRMAEEAAQRQEWDDDCRWREYEIGIAH